MVLQEAGWCPQLCQKSSAPPTFSMWSLSQNKCSHSWAHWQFFSCSFGGNLLRLFLLHKDWTSLCLMETGLKISKSIKCHSLSLESAVCCLFFEQCSKCTQLKKRQVLQQCNWTQLSHCKLVKTPLTFGLHTSYELFRMQEWTEFSLSIIRDRCWAQQKSWRALKHRLTL